MKNLLKPVLFLIMAICCFTNSNAQENLRISATPTVGKQNGIIRFPPPIWKPHSVNISAGSLIPSSAAKDNAFLSNSTAINADVFLGFKIITFPPNGRPKVTFGLNLGGTYAFGGKGGSLGTLPTAFPVNGQTSSIVVDRGGQPIQAEFKIGIGPQVSIQMGKLIISPMVLAQYTSVTQKEISTVQTTVVAGKSNDITLRKLPETKTSGFAITPKLRMQYILGKVAFFGEGAYSMGPKTKTVVSNLVPNGPIQTPGNTYNLQQLQTGTLVNGEVKKTKLNAVGFNFGVSFGFGKSNSPKAISAIRKTIGGVDDGIENIVNCGPGLYPNTGGQCYPCLGCHPCNINVYQFPIEYCDNVTGVKVFEGNAINSVELTNQINKSTTKISDENKKRLLENIEKYKKNDEDIKKGWNGIADAADELENTIPSNARTINNCCNSTVTGSIIWTNPTTTTTSLVTSSALGSHTLAAVSSGIQFNCLINCLSYSGCTATITYKVNGVVVTGSPAPCGVFTIPASYFPAAGGYSIKIIGNCAGTKCKAKELQITIL
jgi:hypothetical protein